MNEAEHVQFSHADNGLPWFLFARSEEHTSELQSQSNLVCRLLLEKKKNTDISSNPFVHGGFDHRCVSAVISFLHYVPADIHNVNPHRQRDHLCSPTPIPSPPAHAR